jgi:hypothetical protein
MDVLDIIKKIGEKESDIRNQIFVSPIFNNSLVATQIFNLVYKFKFVSSKTPGWYKIRPTNTKEARIIGDAEPFEIDSYFKKLYKVRVVLLFKKDNIYLALPEKSNNLGLSVEQPIPILLPEDAVFDFDKVIAGFDGSNFWYYRIDQSSDPSKAAYLRERILKYAQPKTIKYSGLTIEERIAYAFRYNFDKTRVEEAKKQTVRDDVEYAGGKFVNLVEKKDHYSVTYIVDGQQYTSYVSKEQRHTVITAGICLSGEDKKFDLKSLITVMREGQHQRRIHRVGVNVNDEDQDRDNDNDDFNDDDD